MDDDLESIKSDNRKRRIKVDLDAIKNKPTIPKRVVIKDKVAKLMKPEGYEIIPINTRICYTIKTKKGEMFFSSSFVKEHIIKDKSYIIVRSGRNQYALLHDSIVNLYVFVDSIGAVQKTVAQKLEEISEKLDKL